MADAIRFGVVSESVPRGRAWLEHARRRTPTIPPTGCRPRSRPRWRPSAAAGDRFGELELSAFGTFIVTSRRRAATEELIARRGWTGTSIEAAWEMPTLFIGSAAQIVQDLRARRDRFGLSYLITSDRELPTLTQVIEAL